MTTWIFDNSLTSAVFLKCNKTQAIFYKVYYSLNAISFAHILSFKII